MFKDKLIKAIEEGILLTVKYGLLIAVIVYAFAFMNNIRIKAENGNNAALLLVELQKKGYIPQLVNGAVPDKVAEVKR